MNVRDMWDKSLGRFVDTNTILLNSLAQKAADAIAYYLDGQGGSSQVWSADDVIEAIRNREDVVLEALSTQPESTFRMARSLAGGVAPEFGREQIRITTRMENGAQKQYQVSLGHPYMWILQKLAATHPQHVLAIQTDLRWWYTQCQKAQAAIFGLTQEVQQPAPTSPQRQNHSTVVVDVEPVIADTTETSTMSDKTPPTKPKTVRTKRFMLGGADVQPKPNQPNETIT